MDCHKCGYRVGGHHPECIELMVDGPLKDAAVVTWEIGKQHGRAGQERQMQPLTVFPMGSQERRDATWYHQGYNRGEIALEESQNCER